MLFSLFTANPKLPTEVTKAIEDINTLMTQLHQLKDIQSSAKEFQKELALIKKTLLALSHGKTTYDAGTSTIMKAIETLWKTDRKTQWPTAIALNIFPLLNSQIPTAAQHYKPSTLPTTKAA